ncbi:MAG: prenyltransferase/squalene oxidase repeat-containing protein [Actinomycetes bacterium]
MSTAPLDRLLTGDPSIRWQVTDDLLGLPREYVAAERARVATEGWGARLLAEQDPEGSWAGVRLHWERARRFDGGLTLAATVSEPGMCIAGMPIDLAVAFGLRDSRVDDAVEWLTAQQLADGGWNCLVIRRGSGHGSFHTSITVLEAMAADARLTEAIEEVRRAQRPDGTWPRHRPYPGRYWCTMEAPGPSRWSTLRALRVLAWWDGRERT